jgi:hypothetical protein
VCVSGVYGVMWGVCFVCSSTVDCLNLFAWERLLGGLLVIGAGGVGTFVSAGSGGWPMIDSLFVSSEEFLGFAGCWAVMELRAAILEG